MLIVPGLKTPVIECTWDSRLGVRRREVGSEVFPSEEAVPLWTAALSLQFLESCDEVILLEDGEICEKGTHTELMEERGRYAKLIHNLRGLQFKVNHAPAW